MSPPKSSKDIVDPLKNLVLLISFLVDFVLKYSLLFIIALGVGFLVVILLLLNFFNLLGF
jgi:hypothetical protein